MHAWRVTVLILCVCQCVSVCHTAVLKDGESPAADTVDAIVVCDTLSVLNVSDFSLTASQLKTTS